MSTLMQTRESTPRNKALMKILEKNLSKIGNHHTILSPKSSLSPLPTASEVRMSQNSVMSLKRSQSQLPYQLITSQQSEDVVNIRFNSQYLPLFIENREEQLQQMSSSNSMFNRDLFDQSNGIESYRKKHTLNLNQDSDRILENRVCDSCNKELKVVVGRINQENRIQTKKLKERYELQIAHLQKINQDITVQMQDSIFRSQQQYNSNTGCLQSEISRIKIEKDLFTKCQRETIKNLSKNYAQERKGLDQEIARLEDSLLQANKQNLEYRRVSQSLQELEQMITKVINENEQCKMKNQELNKLVIDYLAGRQEFYLHLQELDHLQREAHSQVHQMCVMLLCLASQKLPPLDMILSKHIKFRASFSPQKQKKQEMDIPTTMKYLSDKEDEIDSHLRAEQSRLIEHMRCVMVEYQQKFFESIGFT